MTNYYNDLNIHDLEIMKHAIGLDDNTSIRRKVGHINRNYYTSNGKDLTCEKLVKLGCAKFEHIDDSGAYEVCCYSITFRGIKIVQQIMCIGRIKLESNMWNMGKGFLNKLDGGQ